MRALLREAKWNHGILIITLALAAWAPPAVSRTNADPPSTTRPSMSERALDAIEPTRSSRPDGAAARALVEQWLNARGYVCPDFEVSAVGVPRGADAATFCRGKSCVIRIRPESLHAPIANERTEGSSRRQWENLLLHEAVHYIDIQTRGKSDHGVKFRTLARELGVVYRP